MKSATQTPSKNRRHQTYYDNSIHTVTGTLCKTGVIKHIMTIVYTVTGTLHKPGVIKYIMIIVYTQSLVLCKKPESSNIF